MTINRIRLTARLASESGKPLTTVRASIQHPMINGVGDGDLPNPDKLHYLTEVTISVDGQRVVRCQPGPGVSEDPYWVWKIGGLRLGQHIRLDWRDNHGEQGFREVPVEAQPFTA